MENLETFKNNEELPQVPEGWKPFPVIRRNFGGDRKATIDLISKYRQSNPEYFQKFTRKDGGPIGEYYAPELIAVLSKEKEKMDAEFPKSPEGWKTNKAVRGEVGNFFRNVSKVASTYRETNPEYFRKFRTEDGNVYEHYAPELVEIIKQEVKKINDTPLIPEGWARCNDLVVKLEVNYKVVQKIVENYRKSNPEYFQKFKDTSNNIRECYSPELVNIINIEVEKFKNVPDVPDGWRTKTSLIHEFSTQSPKIGKIADTYRETNPEYFKEFKDKGGRNVEHFGPALVDLIKKEIGKNLSDAPENWLSIDKIAENTGVSKEEADRIVKKLRQKFPEKFGKFKNKDNQ